MRYTNKLAFIYAGHTHSHHRHHTSLHTLLVSCVSIMKLCTCFSALVSSSFLATTATTRAVQPAPWERRGQGGREERRRRKQSTESVSKEEELVNRWLLAGGISPDDWRERGQIWGRELRDRRRKWMGERRGLRGIALFQIHISSCREMSQVYFHFQSIWCEIPSISALYVAEKYDPL